MLIPGENYGKYTIERELGQGAVGVVYQAFDTERDDWVALKVLSKELANDAAYREQLGTEARLCAKIKSPYVVEIFDFGEFDGTPFMAMEYLPGADIRTGVADYEISQKIELAICLGRGIQSAHDEGLVHRDLKPENIRLTDDGTPKILDFGLAQELKTDSVDEFGNVEGTLYYLSPEQLSGLSVTESTDIFSFGTILYELFTGGRPFEGEYSSSIIYSILHEDPAPPSQIKDELPPWIDELIMKLLSKRPEERHQSIREAVAFLQTNKDTRRSPGERWVKPRQTATVVDLKNLSGDDSWEYFCQGFTEDVIRELSRRTNLVVNGEPSTSYRRNIKETFERCRTDFVIVGSLMRYQDKIKLNLSIYGGNGDNLVWDSSFSDSSERLFELLGEAAQETSARLSSAANSPVVGVGEEFQPDVTAYDFYLKGKSYYQTNKPDDLEFARKMFDRVLEIDPKYALAHSGLSDVYAFNYMAYYDRSPECIEKAKEQAQAALEIDAWLPEGLRSLGRYYMFTGQWDKAQDAFLKAVEYNPKYAIGYRTLGWLQHQQGKYKEAFEWARKALEMAPTDLETHLLLGLIHKGDRKYTLAMSTLRRATELGPDYGRAYYELGQVYLKLGIADLALENFELAGKYKGDPNCYVDAGFIHLSRNHIERARTVFNQSIEEQCFPFVANYYLGFCELLEESPEKAKPYFEKTLNALATVDFSTEENIQMQAYLALALAGAGRPEEARKTLDDIEMYEIKNGEVLYNLARCRALLNDTKQANEYIGRALNTPGGPSEKEVAIDPHFRNLTD